jgi:hypothetical protein
MNATRQRPAREEGTLEGDRNGDAVVDNGFCGDVFSNRLFQEDFEQEDRGVR